jgi:CHAT domain
VLWLHIDEMTTGSCWHWRLLDDTDTVLAEHDVALTAEDLASTQLLDLYRSLWRLDTDPAWRAQSERAILQPVGDFIGERILGAIADVLAERAPVTVMVGIGANTAAILGFPLELARYAGASLSSRGLTWCYAPHAATREPLPAPAWRRMLAVFALPVDSSALALVRERRELVRMMASLGISDRFTVLQYGVTRAVLARAVGDPDGWDIIHIAGHGVAGALHLENPDGTTDPVDAAELVELLAPAAGRTRLTVLSACETGIARAARQGLAIRHADLASRPSVTLHSVGLQVAASLGSAVIAMRYPVDDRFSVAFTRGLYRGLLADGAPLDAAFHRATDNAAGQAPDSPLAAATPVLITDAPRMHLVLAHTGAAAAEHVPRAGVPAESPFFVGRTSALATAADVLAPGSAASALALIGMPGLGKTALLVEAAHMHGAQFDRIVWHQLRSTHGLGALGRSLGVPASAACAATADWVRDQRVLIIIDDAHTGLTAQGCWRSAELGEFLHAVSAPGGAARLMLASQRVLPLALHISVALPLLSRSEAGLLSRELAEYYGLSGEPMTAPVGLVCQGHPGLIIDLYSKSAKQIRPATLRLCQLWDVPTPPSPATAAARKPLAATHPGSAIAAWATARHVELAEASKVLLSLVCAIETPDRCREVLQVLWPLVLEHLGRGHVDDLDTVLTPLLAAGLLERAGEESLRVQPAVAAVMRGIDTAVDDVAVDAMAMWWLHFYQRGGEDGADADTIAHWAALAVPYLMRQGKWEQASTCAEVAIHNDDSPEMAARLRPYVTEVVTATADSAQRRATRYVLATVVSVLDREQGLAAMTALYREAQQGEDAGMLVATAMVIADQLAPTSPQQAHRWLQEAISTYQQHPDNPLVSIMLRLKAAKIQSDVGAEAQASLATALQLVQELQELIASGSPLQGVHLPALQSELNEFVATAARRATQPGQPQPAAVLGDWEDPETASQRDAIRAQFNSVSRSDVSGSGDSIAEELLAAILAEYSGPADTAKRGLVLGVLAEMRYNAGSVAEGLEFTRRALRADYDAAACLQAAYDHRQLAVMLAGAGDADLAAVHLLAAAIITVRVSEGLFAVVGDYRVSGAVWTVKMLMARSPDLVPVSYPMLRARLAADIGVDPEALLAGSPRLPMALDEDSQQITITWRTGEPDGSLADVVALASTNPVPAELTTPTLVSRHWGELIDLVAEAACGRAHAESVLGLVAAAGWTDLANALRKVAAGEIERGSADLADVEECIVAEAIAKSDASRP